MALWNNQLKPYWTSIDIYLLYIDTPTHGYITFSFKSSAHPLVYLFLIRLIPKSWDTKWPVFINSYNGSDDLEKSHLEVAVIIPRRVMFQYIEYWLFYFVYFKIRKPMNKIYH